MQASVRDNVSLLKIYYNSCKVLQVKVFESGLYIHWVMKNRNRKANWLLCKYHRNFRPFEKPTKNYWFFMKKMPLFVRGVMNNLYIPVES